MKAHERRARGAYPFFSLSTWDARFGHWSPVKGSHATEADARARARKPGRYRVSRVDDGRAGVDLEPFEV